MFAVASTAGTFADEYPGRWFPFDVTREPVPTVALKPGVDGEIKDSVVFGVSTCEERFLEGVIVPEYSSLARECTSLLEGVEISSPPWAIRW